jgi:hypothetical protein
MQSDGPVVGRELDVRGIDARVPQKLVKDVPLHFSIALHVDSSPRSSLIGA